MARHVAESSPPETNTTALLFPIPDSPLCAVQLSHCVTSPLQPLGYTEVGILNELSAKTELLRGSTLQGLMWSGR